MEIPKEIKSLYRHWDFHTKEFLENKSFNKEQEGNLAKPNFPQNLAAEIKWFIKERINIWENKIHGKKMPYTKDVILQKYRFCNILRELDKQTIEFHKMLNPIRNDFSLWLLNMFYFRMVANIETVKSLGILNFNQNENKIFYEKFIKIKKPKFGVPYVFPISVILKSEWDTREKFISFYLPKVIKKISRIILKLKHETVLSVLEIILPIFKFNLKFLWTEVLIDVHYQFPELVNLNKDFYIGPGAEPTLLLIKKQIVNKKNNSDRNIEKILNILSDLLFEIELTIDDKKIILSAENWEGICCEFRKYLNLKNGSGRKRKF